MKGMSKGFLVPNVYLFLGPTGTESAMSPETLGNDSSSPSRGSGFLFEQVHLCVVRWRHRQGGETERPLAF